MKIMDLKHLQQAFCNALMTSSEKSLFWISSHAHLAPEAQIAIYRNSILGRVIKVLSATFPVCLALVGEPCFRAICRSLIDAFPEQFPEINFFAKRFPLFLQEIKAVQHLAYLSDVAQLEWTYHRMHYSDPIATAIDLRELSQIDESQYGTLCFHLPANCTLLSSFYPILRIWQVNQPGFQGSQVVHLDEGECRLLIYRAENVEIAQLTPEMFALLVLLYQQKSFEWVCESMSIQNPEADIPLLFQEAIQQGWIIGFESC